ncbi:IPT/TIG domain-containing protein [Fulvivirga sp. 29W222]|uniref:IPT/TIG domain-containing protein n=1 Tax=Fulvivirga marina TaxID=2494733 RepID=A0A937KF83_9BACT|nr:IPT/TIG domain-containing protein [Fulvivirga marina]MBL6447933.1 IPT/TIG domain-containing protein [Fulvivirga marina]
MKRYINTSLSIVLLLSVLLYACDLEEPAPAGPSDNPQISEVLPAEGVANETLTLKGSGLGNITSVVFSSDSVPVYINPTLNTDQAFIFRVPLDALTGEQNIIFTNGKGVEFTVPFKVLGFPTVTEVSNYNFSADEEITLTGKNLIDVTQVLITGTSTEITIVSQTATSLTVKMPASELNEFTLSIENSTGVTETEQVFVNRDKAFLIFTDDYAPGYMDATWGAPGAISTEVFKSGTASVGKKYETGTWSVFGFGWTNTANDSFKYLSFWVKGGSIDLDLYIFSQQSPSYFDTFSDFNKISVPANEWTYFKIPVDQLKLWENGPEWNHLGWRIQGPDNGDETIYLDDVMFVR